MAIKEFIPAISRGLLDFLFPEYCPGCEELLRENELGICLPCLAQLPLTDFHSYSGNPVFEQLKPRIPIDAASSAFYFRKGNSIQRIIHEIKYKKAWKAARDLGRYYGYILSQISIYQDIDFMIPVPLHPKRQEERGFNQSEEFCIGLSEVLQKPIHTHHLRRTRPSESQSWKKRKDRFDLLKTEFQIRDGKGLLNQKILLVDDLITTGATLEACAAILYRHSGIPLKIVSIAYTLI